jgi:hypothetical protein
MLQNFIAQAQQEFFGLIPDAMAAVRYALQVETNPTVGLAVLERTGVSAQRGERIQLPETTDGYSRQAIMVANVLLVGREHMAWTWGRKSRRRWSSQRIVSTKRPKSGRYAPSKMPTAEPSHH